MGWPCPTELETQVVRINSINSIVPALKSMNRQLLKLSKASQLILTSFIAIVICIGVGCEKKSTSVEESETVKVEIPDELTLLVVGDEDLGGRIKRQWSARRDGQMKIQNQTIAEFESAEFAVPTNVDIVIYPPTMLGELVTREQLREIPSDFLDSDEYNKAELLRHYRTSIVRQQNETWAVPLGGASFALLCNREAFADIKPIELWDQFDRRLEQLTSTEFLSNDKQIEAKIDMPLAEGWAAHMFLARVAPSVCYRGKLSTVLNRSDMKPLIATEPFVAALDQLKSLASTRSLELTPKSIHQLATSGKTAVAIGWPALGFENQGDENAETGSDGEGDGNSKLDADGLMVKSLPGMPSWFDQTSGTWIKRSTDDDPRVDTVGFSGLIASVSASSGNDRWSWNFLKWLPSKSISKMVLIQSESAGPFRASHLGDAGRWTGEAISLDVADEYADVVSAAHERTQTLMFPRIPGYRQYIAALDEAVRSAVKGEVSSEDALNKAADEWEQITETYGRAKQTSALKKESGL